MIKDRAQKALALRLAVSKKWLPQLEVEIEASQRLDRSRNLLTDVDVLAISQSSIALHERYAFDCKSGAKESGIGRSFWLRGVMTRIGASHGFVVLPEKIKILHDHRISASDMSISLLHDAELVEFARSIGGGTDSVGSKIGELEAWESFLSVGSKYPALNEYLLFARSAFWLLKDPGERCRRVVSRLRSVRSELDPTKPEHMSVFGDAVCLFLVAVSELAVRALLILLKPASKDDFSSTVLAILYGGYENLDAALKLRRITTGASEGEEVSMFPELNRFEQLVREVMLAPLDSMPAALLARDLSFCELLSENDISNFQLRIASDSKFSSKFVLLAAEYLQRAARLPSEFSVRYTERAMALISAVPR